MVWTRGLCLGELDDRGKLEGWREGNVQEVADPGHLVRGRFICFTFSVATSDNSYESIR